MSDMSDLQQFILHRMVWEIGGKAWTKCRDLLGRKTQNVPEHAEDCGKLQQIMKTGEDDQATRQAFLELVTRLRLDRDPEFIGLLGLTPETGSKVEKIEQKARENSGFMIGRVEGDVNITQGGDKDN